ncbi:MAG TPA: ABC transporter permease, partial [Jatrophihabitantaceae bacterium]|nr:ABC transporter permease [Jatrophihabitantaceae bacterium]
MVYLVSGLVLGAVYAMAGAILTLRFASSGILNFAFGAEAYFIARLFYWLNTQHGMATAPAAVLTILVAAPILGTVLYLALYSRLQLADSSIRVTATIGVSVALPALAAILFGSPTILTAPGLARTPVSSIKVFGVAVTYDQLIVLAAVALVAIGGALVMRYSSFGLAMRATVDSPALASLAGTNPSRVAYAACVLSTALAGLTGVVLTPIVGIGSFTSFAALLAASLGAVTAARLRFTGRAAVAGILIGIAGGAAQKILPSGTVWSSAAITTIPFLVMGGAVLWYAARGAGADSVGSGGALDRAIAVDAAGAAHRGLARSRTSGITSTAPRRTWNISVKDRGSLAVIAVSMAVPLLLGGNWVGVYCQGIAYGIIFLSYNLIGGQGGMISLCQITFAGIGALTAAQLATTFHWPVLLAVVVGGGVCLPAGLVVGALGAALGDTYFALITLAFGLLIENLVFTMNRFANYGSGVVINRPGFATSDRSLTYLMFAVFIVVGLLVTNLSRSTLGMAAAAARSSPIASRS